MNDRKINGPGLLSAVALFALLVLLVLAGWFVIAKLNTEPSLPVPCYVDPTPAICTERTIP